MILVFPIVDKQNRLFVSSNQSLSCLFCIFSFLITEIAIPPKFLSSPFLFMHVCLVPLNHQIYLSVLIILIEFGVSFFCLLFGIFVFGLFLGFFLRSPKRLNRKRNFHIWKKWHKNADIFFFITHFSSSLFKGIFRFKGRSAYQIGSGHLLFPGLCQWLSVEKKNIHLLNLYFIIYPWILNWVEVGQT